MKSTGSLTALVIILATALTGFAPLASQATDYPANSPETLRSDTESNSTQCSTEQSPLQTGCATTGLDQAAKTANVAPAAGGDRHHALVQVDATGALLEDLVKTAPN